MLRTIQIAACFFWLNAVAVATAAPVKIDPNPTALMRAMQGHHVVLLGEVHDNAAQHTLRVAALRELLVKGVRPAIALEQFDQERQADIDSARRERPGDADYFIAQAKGREECQWDFYRPFVALALEYDLPIVAANLSRDKAFHVAIDGWPAIFDARVREELNLDSLPAAFRRRHEDAIAAGHCNLLRSEELPARARAQIARDIIMARAIRPYVDRGVVLLAGNGHVRRDIGVPFWLSTDAMRDAISIGVLERNDDTSAPEDVADFDAYVISERAARANPCKELAQRLQSPEAR